MSNNYIKYIGELGRKYSRDLPKAERKPYLKEIELADFINKIIYDPSTSRIAQIAMSANEMLRSKPSAKTGTNGFIKILETKHESVCVFIVTKDYKETNKVREAIDIDNIPNVYIIEGKFSKISNITSEISKKLNELAMDTQSYQSSNLGIEPDTAEEVLLRRENLSDSTAHVTSFDDESLDVVSVGTYKTDNSFDSFDSYQDFEYTDSTPREESMSIEAEGVEISTEEYNSRRLLEENIIKDPEFTSFGKYQPTEDSTHFSDDIELENISTESNKLSNKSVKYNSLEEVLNTEDVLSMSRINESLLRTQDDYARSVRQINSAKVMIVSLFSNKGLTIEERQKALEQAISILRSNRLNVAEGLTESFLDTLDTVIGLIEEQAARTESTVRALNAKFSAKHLMAENSEVVAEQLMERRKLLETVSGCIDVISTVVADVSVAPAEFVRVLENLTLTVPYIDKQIKDFMDSTLIYNTDSIESILNDTVKQLTTKTEALAAVETTYRTMITSLIKIVNLDSEVIANQQAIISAALRNNSRDVVIPTTMLKSSLYVVTGSANSSAKTVNGILMASAFRGTTMVLDFTRKIDRYITEPAEISDIMKELPKAERLYAMASPEYLDKVLVELVDFFNVSLSFYANIVVILETPEYMQFVSTLEEDIREVIVSLRQRNDQINALEAYYNALEGDMENTSFRLVSTESIMSPIALVTKANLGHAKNLTYSSMPFMEEIGRAGIEGINPYHSPKVKAVVQEEFQL